MHWLSWVLGTFPAWAFLLLTARQWVGKASLLSQPSAPLWALATHPQEWSWILRVRNFLSWGLGGGYLCPSPLLAENQFLLDRMFHFPEMVLPRRPLPQGTSTPASCSSLGGHSFPLGHCRGSGMVVGEPDEASLWRSGATVCRGGGGREPGLGRTVPWVDWVGVQYPSQSCWALTRWALG